MPLRRAAISVVAAIGVGTGIGLVTATSPAAQSSPTASSLHTVTPEASQLQKMYGSTCYVRVVAQGAILSSCLPTFDLTPHGSIYGQRP